MKTLFALLTCVCALVGAGGAGAISFGVTEDEVKSRASSHHAALADLGMRENTISVTWNPDNPFALPHDASQIDELLGSAERSGIRVSFAIYQRRPVALASATSPVLLAQFTTWLQTVARRFPSVLQWIGPNEPNQPRFWQPQFTPDCRTVSGAAYATVMGAMYDTLKSVNPGIEVVGVALSPRGNDLCLARVNASTSPVRFLRALGEAYRGSGRKRPLMDSFSFHPYPAVNTDHPLKGYQWPNVGVPNLDRLKQAIHDAFAGTAQRTVEEGLRIRVHESGHETATDGLAGYRGREEVPPVDEATQARYYEQLVRALACDPSIESVNFFHLVDEPDRGGLQSGLVRRDGTRKPSYEAVKRAIVEAGSGCGQMAARWSPATGVVGAGASFRVSARAVHAGLLAREEAVYSAAIFRVDSLTPAGRAAVVRSLSLTSPPKAAAIASRGTVKAYYPTRLRTPLRRLRPGTYIHAIRLAAAMSPGRSTVVVSAPFRVRGRG